MSNQMQTVPKNFRTLVVDFTRDLSTTFPEYSHMWDKWGDEDTTDDQLETLFIFCTKVYPVRFFDILYQNEDIFKEGSDEDVYFFPNMSFRLIFNSEGLSETSKKVIWKYLQLMLFTIVGTMDDKANFGETASMFEGIDEKELQEKLNDAMTNITGLFADMNTEFEKDTTDTNTEPDGEGSLPDGIPGIPSMEGFKNMFKNMPNMEGMPDLDNLQNNLKSMFDGKIGELAKEMAEDIAADFKDVLGDDIDTNANPQDIIKKLMKNPAKISNLMKSVSSKLDAKMKDGSISKEELMKEAGEMMSKMKGMGGEGGAGFQEMFKNMAKSMGGLGKNMRFDQNAMDRMTKREAQVSKMQKRTEIRRNKEKENKEAEFEKIKQRIQAQNEARQKYSVTQTDDPNHLVFKINGDGEQEKTFIHPDLEKMMQDEDEAKANTLIKKKNKKKTNKKNKNKNK
jgi:hypothetical protein